VLKLHGQTIELRGFHPEVRPLVGDLRSDAFEQGPQTAQLMCKGVRRWRPAALDKKSLRDFQAIRCARDRAPAAPDAGHRIVEEMPELPIERNT
jgi:hypothetical protein